MAKTVLSRYAAPGSTAETICRGPSSIIEKYPSRQRRKLGMDWVGHDGFFSPNSIVLARSSLGTQAASQDTATTGWLHADLSRLVRRRQGARGAGPCPRLFRVDHRTRWRLFARTDESMDDVE